MQEVELISIDDADGEEYELANIIVTPQEIGTSVFDGDVAPIWPEKFED